ncbi:MAG TPA: ABC transporter permease [Gemmatimonadales bacterium]
MSDRAGGPLWQLTLWRYREFLREPEAIFWVFAFPILLALALGIAFKSRAPQALNVAVQLGAGDSALAVDLSTSAGLRVETLDSVEAGRRLRTGRVALIAVPGTTVAFVFDSTRDESRVARLLANDALQVAGGRADPRATRQITVTEPGSRYIDFLIPGLLGLNIMGTGLWSIAFGIVRSRNQRLMKRMLAAPMRKAQFLLAQVFARLAFLAFEVGAVLAFGVVAFGVPIHGSPVVLAALVLVGAMAFAGLGLLVASRAKTLEGVSGLMNVVMVPMWIFSGVFFAWSHFPVSMQPWIRALPLTALNDGLRAVLLDGAGFASVLGAMGIMALWGAASFVTALSIFRWT